MAVKEILVTLKIIVEGIEIIIEGGKKLKGIYGPIHKRVPAKIKGIEGFLIWDYIVWNEITFKSDEGEIWSFFTSFSDQETEDVWNELAKRYGT